MDLSVFGFLTDIGVGGILGVFTGYAAKVIIKLVMILFGLYLFSLIYLHTRGFITIHGNVFKEFAGPWLERFPDLFQSLAMIAPMGGGFIAGFYLGFKKL